MADVIMKTGGNTPPLTTSPILNGSTTPGMMGATGTMTSQLPPLSTSPIMGGSTTPGMMGATSTTGGLQGLTLNGQDYVANPTNPTAPGAQYSAANVVNGISQQVGTGLSSVTPGAAIGGLQNQFNFTPTGTAGGVVAGVNNQFKNPTLPNATKTVTTALDQLLSADNPYIASARRAGLEFANSRGMLNSSIAAGASQRSAIDASMPILNQIMGLNNQREGQTFQQTQQARQQAVALASQREQQAHQQAQSAFDAAAQLTGQDRQNAFANAQNLLNQANQLTQQREGLAFQGQENAANRVQQVNRDMLGAQLSEWQNSQEFNRQFNGQLAMMPIKNAADLTKALSMYAMENPELYTPEIVSGMSNFLNLNMISVMQSFFPNMTGGTA